MARNLDDILAAAWALVQEARPQYDEEMEAAADIATHIVGLAIKNLEREANPWE